jgi:transcriptional regulator with XRE-family HTH domain
MEKSPTRKRKQYRVERWLALVGARIRELRVERGYTQESFAAHANLARAYVGQIERGEVNLSLSNLIKIAAALDAEVGALVPPIESLAEDVVADASSGEDTGANARDKPRGNARNTETEAVTPIPSPLETRQQRMQDRLEGAGPLLSTGAAAAIVGVHGRTLERWASAGLIPADWVRDKSGRLAAVFRPSDINRLATELQERRLLDRETGNDQNAPPVANSHDGE